MGLCYAECRAIMTLLEDEKSIESIATLGRQNIYLHTSEIAALTNDFKSKGEASEYFKDYVWGSYADDFFRKVIRAHKVDSIDFSDFEGASIVHDLSIPIDERLTGAYDLVIDGGTLEHVFDFPTGIRNMMRMTRKEGHILSCVPANNRCGHGFYQFSPELMFRLFAPGNSFEVRWVHLIKSPFPGGELTAFNPVYETIDPDTIGRRINLMTSAPINMMTLARRIDDHADLSKVSPLQSDYVARWHGKVGGGRSLARKVEGYVKRFMPDFVFRYAKGFYQSREASLSNRDVFKHLK